MLSWTTLHHLHFQGPNLSPPVWAVQAFCWHWYHNILQAPVVSPYHRCQPSAGAHCPKAAMLPVMHAFWVGGVDSTGRGMEHHWILCQTSNFFPPMVNRVRGGRVHALGAGLGGEATLAATLPPPVPWRMRSGCVEQKHTLLSRFFDWLLCCNSTIWEAAARGKNMPSLVASLSCITAGEASDWFLPWQIPWQSQQGAIVPPIVKGTTHPLQLCKAAHREWPRATRWPPSSPLCWWNLF